jgi:hypothetical protein
MSTVSPLPNMSLEKRRSKRFGINLPVQIEVLGGKRVSRSAETSNIGSGGVSFPSAKEAKVGGKIEYLITLADGKTPVRIRCFGKVLRIEPKSDIQTPWQVTATIDRYKFIRETETALRPQ